MFDGCFTRWASRHQHDGHGGGMTVMVVDVRNKQKALNARAGRENEQLTTMSKELSQLKERVQILERVVTDKGFSVEQEINNL